MRGLNGSLWAHYAAIRASGGRSTNGGSDRRGLASWLSGTPGSTPSWRIEALKTEHFYLALTDANFQTVGHFARFPEQCLL